MDLNKTDLYQNLVKYSPDILQKTKKVLDIINTDKTCFIKINVELSPQVKDPFSWKKQIPITALNSDRV